MAFRTLSWVPLPGATTRQTEVCVDDIQLLVGKRADSGEFVHPFNGCTSRSAIVLTCDRPASVIQGIGHRGIRLKGGLVTDKQPPDCRERLAISFCAKRPQLMRRGSAGRIPFNSGQEIRTNIRRLKGAFDFCGVSRSFAEAYGKEAECGSGRRSVAQKFPRRGGPCSISMKLPKKVAEHFDIGLAI